MCGTFTGWVKDRVTPAWDGLCDSCKELPADIKIPLDHIREMQQLERAGESGRQLLPCSGCGQVPPECNKCPQCSVHLVPGAFPCSNPECTGWQQEADSFCHRCYHPVQICTCVDRPEEYKVEPTQEWLDSYYEGEEDEYEEEF